MQLLLVSSPVSLIYYLGYFVDHMWVTKRFPTLETNFMLVFCKLFTYGVIDKAILGFIQVWLV